MAMALSRATLLIPNRPCEMLTSVRQAPRLVCMPATTSYPRVVCGRGDKRTAKGKRFRHSFGNCRPRKPSKGRGLPPTPLPPKPASTPEESMPAQA